MHSSQVDLWRDSLCAFVLATENTSKDQAEMSLDKGKLL